MEGARDLLEEVVASADGTLKSKAQGMLDTPALISRRGPGNGHNRPMSDPPIERLALGLSYRGSAYQGWQSQPGGRTVQDRVEAALQAFADAADPHPLRRPHRQPACMR